VDIDEILLIELVINYVIFIALLDNYDMIDYIKYFYYIFVIFLFFISIFYNSLIIFSLSHYLR
jgi:hypothetical protein